MPPCKATLKSRPVSGGKIVERGLRLLDEGEEFQARPSGGVHRQRPRASSKEAGTVMTASCSAKGLLGMRPDSIATIQYAREIWTTTPSTEDPNLARAARPTAKMSAERSTPGWQSQLLAEARRAHPGTREPLPAGELVLAHSGFPTRLQGQPGRSAAACALPRDKDTKAEGDRRRPLRPAANWGRGRSIDHRGRAPAYLHERHGAILVVPRSMPIMSRRGSSGPRLLPHPHVQFQFPPARAAFFQTAQFERSEFRARRLAG